MYHTSLIGNTLKESIKTLSMYSDAYIESVLWAKFSYKYSIVEISNEISNFRNN